MSSSSSSEVVVVVSEEDPPPRKKNFHSHSVSVPLDVPPHPGVCSRVEIPFGPPVMHLEPEKTLYAFPHNPLLCSQGGDGSIASSYFFNPNARSIFPSGNLVEEEPFPMSSSGEGEEDNEKMEE